MVHDIRYRTVFISVFVIGLFVHGSRFFTVYLSHDDLTLTGPGTTFTSGRWLLQYLYELDVRVLGSHINAKGFIAIASLFLLALSCCLIARDLQLQSKPSLILLSAVVVTFPFVTSLFGYTFTATYYYIANLMALVAASLVQRILPIRQFWWRLALCAVLLGLSIAIYQSTLCIFMAYLMILSIKESICGEDETWKSFFVRCGMYLLGCVAGYVLYTISNKVVLAMKGLEMSSYQGLDQMGSFTISQILHRLVFAYKEFFLPSLGQEYSLYSLPCIRYCYVLVVLAIVVLCCVFLVRAIQKKAWAQTVQLVILFLLTPIAINSIYVIVDMQTTTVYALMLFGCVFTLIFPIFAMEHLQWGKSFFSKHSRSLAKYGCLVTALLLVYSSAYFAYTANACYTKIAIQQQQTVSYFTRLVTRIQSVEGYSTSLPVAYINPLEKDEEQLPLHEFNMACTIRPARFTSNINQYNWQSYMRIWCGFAPATLSEEKTEALSNSPEVQDMPCYPNDGSIQIIDGVIVVKFAD